MRAHRSPEEPDVVWVARVGDLRDRSFELIPTDEAPHFDIVLPELTGGTDEVLPAPAEPVEGGPVKRQLTVDFNRVVRDDLIRANARRPVPGTGFEVGATVTVGDDDWGVAPVEVVEYDEATGALVLRVLKELRSEETAPSVRSA